MTDATTGTHAAEKSIPADSIMVGDVEPPQQEHDFWDAQLDAVFNMSMRDIVRAEIDVASPHRGGLAWEAAELGFPSLRIDFDFFRVMVVEGITEPLLVQCIDSVLGHLGIDPDFVPRERRNDLAVIRDTAIASDAARGTFKECLRLTIDATGEPPVI